MDKKMRLVVFGLAIFLVVSIFISLRLYNSKQLLSQEYSDKQQQWQKEKDGLDKKLSVSEQEKTRLQERMAAVQKDLNALSSERDDWKKKFDVINKEKEDLVAKLQRQPKEMKETEAVETKTAAVVTDEYWAKILKEKAELAIKLKDLDTALKDTRLEMAKVKDDKQTLILELKNSTMTRQDLERKLEYDEKLTSTLSFDLVREKNDKNLLVTQLEEMKKDNAQLRSKLQSKEKANITLMNRLNDLQAEKDALAKKAASMDLVLQSKLDDMVSVKKEFEAIKETATQTTPNKSVELPPIIVKGSAKTPSNIVVKEGKVIAINEENNFIVIDLGESAGIRTGNIFRVTRDNKQIATVEVIQTRKDIAAADIRQIEPGRKIRVGDLVR